jgi:hypothetical protein
VLSVHWKRLEVTWLVLRAVCPGTLSPDPLLGAPGSAAQLLSCWQLRLAR